MKPKVFFGFFFFSFLAVPLGLWDLSGSTVEVQSPNHWTAREFPHCVFFIFWQKWLKTMINNERFRDFSGGLVVKIVCFHCRGHGFDPWWGLRSSTAQGVAEKKINKNNECFRILSYLQMIKIFNGYLSFNLSQYNWNWAPLPSLTSLSKMFFPFLSKPCSPQD